MIHCIPFCKAVYIILISFLDQKLFKFYYDGDHPISLLHCRSNLWFGNLLADNFKTKLSVQSQTFHWFSVLSQTFIQWFKCQNWFSISVIFQLLNDCQWKILSSAKKPCLLICPFASLLVFWPFLSFFSYLFKNKIFSFNYEIVCRLVWADF